MSHAAGSLPTSGSGIQVLGFWFISTYKGSIRATIRDLQGYYNINTSLCYFLGGIIIVSVYSLMGSKTLTTPTVAPQESQFDEKRVRTLSHSAGFDKFDKLVAERVRSSLKANSKSPTKRNSLADIMCTMYRGKYNTTALNYVLFRVLCRQHAHIYVYIRTSTYVFACLLDDLLIYSILMYTSFKVPC